VFAAGPPDHSPPGQALTMRPLMARWRATLAAGSLALAVAAGGCGGGPDEVSSEELVARGDEICRDGIERFAELQPEPPANAAEAVDLTRQLIEVSEDVLSELRDLGPPDELEAGFGRYLEARGRALEFFRRGEDAAQAQDAQAYAAAQQGVAKSASERRRLAEAVGFEVCSNPEIGAEGTR
jgi:hypothetical protein